MMNSHFQNELVSREGRGMEKAAYFGLIILRCMDEAFATFLFVHLG